MGGQVARLREAIEAGDCESMRERGAPAQGRLGQRGSRSHALLRRRHREAGCWSATLSEREKAAIVAELDHQINLLMALAEEKGGLM